MTKQKKPGYKLQKKVGGILELLAGSDMSDVDVSKAFQLVDVLRNLAESIADAVGADPEDVEVVVVEEPEDDNTYNVIPPLPEDYDDAGEESDATDDSSYFAPAPAADSALDYYAPAPTAAGDSAVDYYAPAPAAASIYAPAPADDSFAPSPSSSAPSRFLQTYNVVPVTPPSDDEESNSYAPRKDGNKQGSGEKNSSKTSGGNSYNLCKMRATYGIKTDNNVKARQLENSLVQRGFEDAVVTGFNARSTRGDNEEQSTDRSVEIGGAINRNVHTEDIEVEDDRRAPQESELQKIANEVKSLSWYVIVLLVAGGAFVMGLMCFCVNSCCCRKSRGNREAAAVKTKSSYANSVGDSTLFQPTVAWRPISSLTRSAGSSRT